MTRSVPIVALMDRDTEPLREQQVAETLDDAARQLDELEAVPSEKAVIHEEKVAG